jgi:ribonucleoside-diphosphate reductase alpha chain
MKITRRFTKPGQDVFETVEWEKRRSRISDTDGKVVFEMRDAEVPKQWSQLATDIVVSRYFRRGDIPQHNDDGSPKLDDNGQQVTGPERSVRQVVNRLAGCWRHWGEKHGYFNSRIDAEAFYDELSYMLLHQVAAPNSPQWFNTGVNWAYGISGPPQGHYVPDPATGEPQLAPDAFTHCQAHACFIQPIRDDLVNDGGIMDLWTREARLFKYGSGTGTNFSTLRGENEPLSGGGKSSGLMSFLRIGDRAAGAIKSGGTTRRAAKMVCLDADHPDIEAFINWKVREELKVAAMVEGMKHLSPDQRALAEAVDLDLNYDFNGEAYHTVSGQNSNNSVRLSDSFFEALDADGDWHLRRRTDGQIAKTLKARDLWKKITAAAWNCADPGIQFETTTNAWHTCPAGGRINASNPCNEYVFLDNTACNLASINLMKFYDPESKIFDIDGFEHAIRMWTTVLEITVLMAAYPSREIAAQSWRYRTLGLGYANLGAMLMQAGIPYDSDEGRAVTAVVTAILTGRANAASAELARQLGPFAGFEENRESMLRVIRNHHRAASGAARDSGEYEDLPVKPVPIDHELFRDGRVNLANADDLLVRAMLAWDEALLLGEKSGYRNAQTTAIAPTGTIGLLMDCDTTGVEPDFALTKFKKLAGGGYFKIANQSLRPALRTLGYDEKQVDEILTYVMGTLSLDVPLPEQGDAGARTFRDFLVDHDYNSEELVELENQLPTVFELGLGFTAWSMPPRVLEALGIDVEAAREKRSFDGLRALGLSHRQIQALDRAVCGTQTVEGAPHLREEHLPVFDCANTCGRIGRRFIATEGHIRMMAAAQPFISGAISKTINLTADSTLENIAEAYRLSWELGLKANALYRDGSKLSQPLNTRSGSDADIEEDQHEPPPDGALEVVPMPTADVEPAAAMERVVERIVDRPLRRRLPDTRASITHRFNVSGHEGYLTVGLYENGSPGELFITMAKEGSTIGGLMDCLGTAISVALQYGVPVESLVKKFAHQRFEPMGMTTNSNIPFAKSLVDYIFRWLGMEFVEGYREANAPKRPSDDVPANRLKPPPATDERRADVGATEPAAGGPPPSNGNREPDDESAAAEDHGPSAALASEARRLVAQTATDRNPLAKTEPAKRSTVISAMERSNAALMGDAPACDTCGAITMRNGTCYKCMNCGNSMGCS